MRLADVGVHVLECGNVVVVVGREPMLRGEVDDTKDDDGAEVAT